MDALLGLSSSAPSAASQSLLSDTRQVEWEPAQDSTSKIGLLEIALIRFQNPEALLVPRCHYVFVERWARFNPDRNKAIGRAVGPGPMPRPHVGTNLDGALGPLSCRRDAHLVGALK